MYGQIYDLMKASYARYHTTRSLSRMQPLAWSLGCSLLAPVTTGTYCGIILLGLLTVAEFKEGGWFWRICVCAWGKSGGSVRERVM